MRTLAKNKNSFLEDAALKERGLVVLSLRKYDAIRKKIAKLRQEKKIAMEAAETLRIIAEGEREYRAGKLKPIKSLAELDK